MKSFKHYLQKVINMIPKLSDGLILYAKEPTKEMISLIFKEIAEKQFEFILKSNNILLECE